jgi:Na+/melibiose symporter-like transporter
LRAGLLVPLLWCDRPSRVWVAYAVMLALSTVSQFDRPAQGALVPALVGEQDLLAANAVLSANLSVVQLLAPLAGGVLFALVGLPAIVLADIASYLVSAATLLRVPEPGDRTAADLPPASVLQGLRDGLRTIAASPLLRACVGTTMLLSLAGGFLTGVIVPYASDVLGGGSAGLGVLVTVQGVGTLAGLALAPWVGQRVSVRIRVAGCSVACMVAASGLALAPSIPWAAPPLLATGAVTIGMLTLQTLLQTSVPPTLVGRVFAAWSSGQAAASLLGLVTAATLADVIGVRGVLLATLPLFALSALIPVRQERPQLALA